MENLKPPLGCIPKWLHVEERIKHLSDGIKRYRKANLEPLKEWLIEYYELSEWLSNYRSTKTV